MNILVLSSGGPAAHGVIKSLRKIDTTVRIVSVDCYELSAGFYLSDSYYVVPKADENNYINTILEIVDKESIDLILPTGGDDIVTISKNSHLFKCKLFMSDYD